MGFFILGIFPHCFLKISYMYVSQLNCVVVLSFILKPCQTLNLIQCLSIEIGIIQMEVPIFSKIAESSTTVSSPARRYYLPHFGNITTMFEISWCLFRSYPPPPCVFPCIIQITKITTLCLPYTLILGCT